MYTPHENELTIATTTGNGRRSASGNDTPAIANACRRSAGRASSSVSVWCRATAMQNPARASAVKTSTGWIRLWSSACMPSTMAQLGGAGCEGTARRGSQLTRNLSVRIWKGRRSATPCLPAALDFRCAGKVALAGVDDLHGGDREAEGEACCSPARPTTRSTARSRRPTRHRPPSPPRSRRRGAPRTPPDRSWRGRPSPESRRRRSGRPTPRAPAC